ncbi:hypothetical protein FRC09_006836, partial [Ceratobasidium sp. 395]
MSSLPVNVYRVAFSHWSHVQEQLAQMIQDYADACSALKMALEILPIDYPSRDQRAEAFSGLDSQLSTLASHERALQEARLSLTTARNASDNLAPINSLPIEILSAIFVSAIQRGVDEICNLTLVCKEWRQITLQAPACWSKIELPVGPNDSRAFDRVYLWAERAQSQQLHLSIWERLHMVPEFEYGEDTVDEAADMLAPLMSRIHTMEFRAHSMEMHGFMPKLLGCWVEHGSAGTAKALKLDIPQTRTTVHLTAGYGSAMQDYGLTTDNYKAFFGSLRILSLGNIKLDRELGFYSGLVDLCLGPLGRYDRYTRWDVAAILEASPGLRSLAIIGLEITIDWSDTSEPSAVALNNLNELRLESNTSPQNFWTVLRMITSTSDSIQVSLTPEDHPEFMPAARSFFERFKVTALYIHAPYFGSCPVISPLFVRMPHLEHLAIQNCPIFDSDWLNGPTSANFWPKLDDLSLTDCKLLLEDSQKLLSIGTPRTLWLQETSWDAQVRNEVEAEMNRHGVEVITAEGDGHMPIRSWDFMTRAI